MRTAGLLRGYQKGFTLTELAIVLGVVGIILSAIWVAAAVVYTNNRTQSAVNETVLIVGNYRTLFSTHGVDIADWTDITCMGVNAGFFPKPMLPPGQTCTTGIGATYPQHPWNNYFQVYSHQGMQGIMILLGGLTQDACNRFTNQIGDVPDVIYQDINNTVSRTLPPYGTSSPLNETDINANCVAGNGNYVQVMFKAR